MLRGVVRNVSVTFSPGRRSSGMLSQRMGSGLNLRLYRMTALAAFCTGHGRVSFLAFRACRTRSLKVGLLSFPNPSGLRRSYMVRTL